MKKNILILIKPASSLCNLDCKYCFYNDEAEKREVSSFGIMTEGTTKNVISKAIDFADGGSVNFMFQGGEPLVAGYDYFVHFIKYVDEINVNKIKITYGLQTNGTLLTEELCKFFHNNQFLIGVSIDGKADLHNANRITKDGKGSFNKVMQGVDLLKKHKVEFNVLSVVTSLSRKKAKETYKFFRSHDMNYMQFITCLEPFEVEPLTSGFALSGEGYFEFYKTLFDLYVADKISGKEVYIRYFDNLLEMMNGARPELCGLNGHCGIQLVVEGNGNCYPCDFYCDEKYLMGNINEKNLDEMAMNPCAEKFTAPSYKIEEKCIDCEVKDLCRGGCRRERDYMNDGNLHLNIYCEGRKKFFKYFKEKLAR